VHIVYQGTISTNAFLLQSRQDKRIFFVIPFKGNSLICTTDTDYDQGPDDVKVEEEDIVIYCRKLPEYFPTSLLNARKLFPPLPIKALGG